jgi:lipoprotein-anchoring transpeptidase ErfK/SrfK
MFGKLFLGLGLFCALFSGGNVWAQKLETGGNPTSPLPLPSGQITAEMAAANPRIRNFKLLEEYPDGKGHLVRVVQFSEGNMRVRQTIIIPNPALVKEAKWMAINPDTIHKDRVLILVDKSDYSVLVYYNKRPIRNYRAVFGPNPLADKCQEGDRCTPEGEFTIQRINPKSQYNKFMLLSYPNDSAKVRFARLQATGKISKTARIGNSIGIHGIWPGGDDMIELGVGWTDGCVALRNRDVDELAQFVGVGTKVMIRK